MLIRRCAVFAVALVCALLASAIPEPVPAAVAAEERIEPGAAAIAGGWMCRDGNPARTGRSLALFHEAAPEAAWTLQLPGAADSEPVTWDDWVFVSARTPRGTRMLHMVSIADGRVAAKKEYRTEFPLQTCVTGGIVVVRSGPSKVSAMRCRDGQLFDIWTADTTGPADSLLAIGREVYVRGPASVARLQVMAARPVWSTAARFRGNLAIRGASIYLVSYDDDGNAALEQIDRKSGVRSSVCRIGHHRGDVPSSVDENPIVALEDSVVVDHSLPIPSADGGAFRQTRTVRERDSGRLTGRTGLYEGQPGVLETDSGWVDPGGRLDWEVSLRRGRGDGILLAAERDKSEFASGWSLASAVRRGMYHPAGAVRLPDLRVRWRWPVNLTTRAVPCGRSLVAVAAGDKLVAFRPAGPGGKPATVAAPATSPAPVAGRVCLRSGEVLTGPVSVDGTAIVVGTPPAVKRVPHTVVLLAETADGSILHAGPIEDVVAAHEFSASAAAGQELGQVLQSATKLADPVFLQNLLLEGIEREVPQADIDRLDARVKDLLRPGKATKQDPAAAAELRAKADAIIAKIPANVGEGLRRSLRASSGHLRIDLVRELLRRSPADEEAGNALRELLPPGVQPKRGTPASHEWADLAETAATIPLKVIHPKPASDPNLTRAERAVGLATTNWRPDLIGIASDRILVITPSGRPGPVARCIGLGELVCSALDEMFAGGEKRRDEREPLTILVYESKDEYVAEVTKAGESPPHGVEATAGFYSPQYEIARLYIPADAEEFGELVPTFAHELTHQWLDLRCPLFKDGERRRTLQTKGYWIVEGFASFVEDFDLSLRDRTWSAHKTTRGGEVVALAPAGGLHPWMHIFTMRQSDFARIPRSSKFKVRLPDRLGWQRDIDGVRLFYDQSAAACAALWHMDDGAWRAKLIRYIGRYYRGEAGLVEDEFGIGHAELGKKIEAWCGRK